MKIEYSLTADDVREALAPPQQRRDNIWGALVGYAVLLALAIPIAAGEMGEESPADVLAAMAATPRNLWTTLAPSLVGFTLVAGGTLLSRRRASRGQFTLAGRKPSRQAQVGSSILIAVSFAWMILPNVPMLTITWHPTLRRELWAAVAPWFAYGIYACAIVLTQSRHTAAIVGATALSMRRPIAVDVSDDGITSLDELVESRIRWPHFVSYRETANLLLLWTEDGSPLILPKRAVPDQIALRGLIQTHVATGTFLPRDAAFPVAVLPLPSEPE